MTILFRLAMLILFCWSFVAMAQQPEIETTQAKMVPITDEFILDGVIEAINQATLSAEVSGRIEAIHFDVDDIVKQGEVLVRIRDNEYRARLEQSKATLSEAATVFDNAEREFNRIDGLYKDKVVSKAQYDQASATLESSRARVKSAQASVRQEQIHLDNTIIRAPYSGVVVARHVKPGELTSIGQPIMSGYALGKLRVNVDAPQSIINKIRHYRKTRVILLDHETGITADQLTIFPVADSESHAFRIRIDLPAQNKQLFPGMLVKAAFVTDQVERLLIPLQSLVRRSEITAVYVIDAAKQIQMRQVRTGITEGDQIEIVAGLDSGEQVAIDPVQAGIRLKAMWARQ
ncbi:MAG: efflux RND transporter periplasmic adaptor subunit [Gammaproteobacteria bacterium]|nr:efflux RND transporter periplasmic adaptor subunit [Gammaproteobacteria bacterium]